MEKEVNKLHTHIGRSKFAIFAVVGFLAILTYLLITVSGQLASDTVTTGSSAYDSGRGGATLPVEPGPDPITDQPPAQCGELCSYQSTNGINNFEIECAEGSTCEHVYSDGAAVVKACKPIGGGACPLPMAQCGRGCSDEKGNITHQCAGESTCEHSGFLNYHICTLGRGKACPRIGEAHTGPKPGEPEEALPVAGCGEICITRENNQETKTVAVCAPGYTCQDEPHALGYLAPSRCYPEDQHGYCPLDGKPFPGNPELPVEPPSIDSSGDGFFR